MLDNKGSTHFSVLTVNSRLLSPPTTSKVHFLGESTFLYDLPLNEEIFGIGGHLPPLQLPMKKVQGGRLLDYLAAEAQF